MLLNILANLQNVLRCNFNCSVAYRIRLSNDSHAFYTGRWTILVSVCTIDIIHIDFWHLSNPERLTWTTVAKFFFIPFSLSLCFWFITSWILKQLLKYFYKKLPLIILWLREGCWFLTIIIMDLFCLFLCVQFQNYYCSWCQLNVCFPIHHLHWF